MEDTKKFDALLIRKGALKSNEFKNLEHLTFKTSALFLFSILPIIFFKTNFPTKNFL
jgi:hypothetical protein